MGWQWAFIIVGGIGFAWLGFWFIIYDSPKKLLAKGKITQSEYDYIHSDKDEQLIEKNEVKEKVSWFKLLTYRQTWSFVFGKFLTDGVLVVFLVLVTGLSKSPIRI